MRFPGNVVTAEDTRARGNGVPTKCFYCNGIPGGPHDAECVCVDRPVHVRLTLDLIVTVPRSWTKEQAEFRWNESTYCMDNIIEEIQRQADADGSERCMCSRAEIRLLGDATIEEAIAAGLKPDTEHD